VGKKETASKVEHSSSQSDGSPAGVVPSNSSQKDGARKHMAMPGLQGVPVWALELFDFLTKRDPESPLSRRIQDCTTIGTSTGNMGP
jgi:hypothetical protein